MMTTTRNPATRTGGGWLRRTGAVTVAAAAAGTLVWSVARPIGVHVAVGSGPDVRDIGLPSVVVTSVVVAVLAGLTRRVIARWSAGPGGWYAVSGAVLLVSLLGPASAVSVAAGLVLVALHLAVAAVVVLGLSAVPR